jgi:hypothetical protein
MDCEEVYKATYTWFVDIRAKNISADSPVLHKWVCKIHLLSHLNRELKAALDGKCQENMEKPYSN